MTPLSQLPIDDVLAALFAALASHTQVILKAPPGAGKSTRLPLSLLETNTIAGRIIMLEPRRLAARNIAGYLAQQLGERVGQTVGLRVRGETKVSAQTRLEIVTEGVMTRMLQHDPELAGIGLIIFDEFHERSIHADTALALAIEVQQALRDDLQLLVMSATLDQTALAQLLPTAAYVESQGRCFPVEYRYQHVSDPRDVIDHMAAAISQLLAQESGSVLAFLPGVGEIKRLAQALAARLSTTNNNSPINICPLYGQLPIEQQQQAINPAPAGQRKVVLATNIAETSLTIEGIRLVVDSGFERIALWEPKTGISRLQQVRIAQSSAEQRAGRAGRLEAGICLRMYSEELLQRQPATPQPEILRSDLTALAMDLVQWGCNDPQDLQWLDVPPMIALQQSLQLLQQLGAIDERGQQTSRGKVMQTIGADPRHGAMLAFAQQMALQQTDMTILTTAAMLVALLEDPPRGIDNPDLAFQLHLLETKKLARSHAYLQRAQQHLTTLAVSKNTPLKVNNHWAAILLAVGFPDRIAQSRTDDGRYQLANGQGVVLDSSQSLASQSLLVVADVVKTRQGDSRIFSAIAADVSVLQQTLPLLFTECDWLDWDDKKGRLSAEHRVCCGKLIVARSLAATPDSALASEALLNAVKRKGLGVLNWTEKANALLIRGRCANEWLPELGLPALDEVSLLSNAEQWLLPYLNGITTLKGLQKVNMVAALEACLGWNNKQQLEQLLPTHYQVPTGSNITIRYQEQQQPVLAVKLQEMFGEPTTPTIANGKVALVLELLSPAQRPLQITQDLAGFWQGSYKEVQKEMKGRYPKHPWPDDPANHIPTRKIKKYL